MKKNNVTNRMGAMKWLSLACIGLLPVLVMNGCKKEGKATVKKPADTVVFKNTNAGTVSTIAGSGSPGHQDGPAISSAFSYPGSVAADASGNIYVVDQGNHDIRKITPGGVVSTFAGSGSSGYADGTGTSAKFNSPSALALDADGNVYVADMGNSCIRKITPAGVVSTYAGQGGVGGFADGSASAALFNDPHDIAIDASKNLFVVDQSNNRIRKITPSGIVSTFAGTGDATDVDGPVATATLNRPSSIAIDSKSGNIYVAQFYCIKKITPAGTVSLFSGSLNGPTAVSEFFVEGSLLGSRYFDISCVRCDKGGNVYIVDSGNDVIRKTTADGQVNIYAGSQYVYTLNPPTIPVTYQDGPAKTAFFHDPTGIAIEDDGTIIVGDKLNHDIRKISAVPL